MVDCVQVVAVVHSSDVPAVALEPGALVGGRGQIRAAVDGDAVVVEDPDELAELLMSGESGCLVRDALHDVAVGAERDRVMIGEPAFRQGHSHAGGNALAEGTRGHLHARDVAILWVSGGGSSPLAKVADVFVRDVVAAQVEKRVQEHRRVTAREHESVAVEPLRVAGIVLQMLLEEDVTDRCERHGRARMAGVGGLDRIHGKDTDGVYREALEVVHPTTKFTRRSFT